MAFAWDIDGTALPGYQQADLFAFLRELESIAELTDSNRPNIDLFWEIVNRRQAVARLHPHRNERNEIISANLLLELNDRLGWEVSNDTLLIAGEYLRFADHFVRFNERLKRYAYLHGLNAEVYCISGGWARYMAGSALNKTMILGGKPVPVFDAIWATDFRSQSGRDSDTITLSAGVIDAAQKYRIINKIAEGSNVWPERKDHDVPPEELRIPYEHIMAFADGPTDRFMWERAGRAVGVWFERLGFQGEPTEKRLARERYNADVAARMRGLVGRIIDFATPADYAPGQPLEQFAWQFVRETHNRVFSPRRRLQAWTKDRWDALRGKPAPEVLEIGGHSTGDAMDAEVSHLMDEVSFSEDYHALAADCRGGHVDSVGVARYMRQFGVLGYVDEIMADELRRSTIPTTFVMHVPTSKRNDFSIKRMLARLNRRTDVDAWQDYDLSAMTERPLQFKTDYGTVELRRLPLGRISAQQLDRSHRRDEHQVPPLVHVGEFDIPVFLSDAVPVLARQAPSINMAPSGSRS